MCKKLIISFAMIKNPDKAETAMAKEKRLTEAKMEEILKNPQKTTIEIQIMDIRPGQRILTFRGAATDL